MELRQCTILKNPFSSSAVPGYLYLHSSFIDSDGKPIKEYLMEDCVHLSEKGYRVWAKVVEDFLDITGSHFSSDKSLPSTPLVSPHGRQ